jgi:uroporphyrinogen-III synthase
MNPSFDNLRVLALESRLSSEMGTLIANYGGRATVAPSMREVPLTRNPAALDFAAALDRGDIDIVIFLTGVGARMLMSAVAETCPKDRFSAALSRVKVVARGPKPLSVLRELKVPVWVTAPEPNTWHELLSAIDGAAGAGGLKGARIAIQEYGVSNDELMEALRARGAAVTAIPVYQWALPEDLTPLRAAVTAIVHGDVDVVFFTTRIQVMHLCQIAAEMALAEELAKGLRRMVVASIGPTTSEELRHRRLPVDVEPSHPKIGFLVRETAERAGELLARKREGQGDGPV